MVRCFLIWIKEYGAKIMFLKNGFFVSLVNRTLKLDTLIGTEQWKGVDVLIFNSYHWWLHTGRLKMWADLYRLQKFLVLFWIAKQVFEFTTRWDNYEIGNKILTDMDVKEAYKTALTTWANWIDSNVDPTKTRVFFQGISPVHYQYLIFCSEII